MKRTKYPPGTVKKRMINYYDIDRKQRWGTVEKESKTLFVVSNVLGEKIKVPKDKVIEERMYP